MLFEKFRDLIAEYQFLAVHGGGVKWRQRDLVAQKRPVTQ